MLVFALYILCSILMTVCYYLWGCLGDAVEKLNEKSMVIRNLEQNYESLFNEQQISQFEQSRLKKDCSELLKKLNQINTILNPEDK